MLTPIMRELPGRVNVIRLGWLFALTIYLGALAPAATEYPDRPITVIIPFPPGGSTGYTAKVLAEEMAKIVNQPVAVEPKTGNFGINAIEAIIGKADGYTLLVGSIITNSMTPVMHRQKIRFDYGKEVVPVTKLAAFPSVLMTAPSKPADNLKDALARLKGSGKLRFGTDFPGTYVDVDFINLGKAADLKVSMRSANGALAILDDLIADKIDMAMLNVATATANRGKYKPLAVTGRARFPISRACRPWQRQDSRRSVQQLAGLCSRRRCVSRRDRSAAQDGSPGHELAAVERRVRERQCRDRHKQIAARLRRGNQIGNGKLGKACP